VFELDCADLVVIAAELHGIAPRRPPNYVVATTTHT